MCTSRVAFLMGMQLSVLASTLLAGPVDTSLLALIGDVIATPILAAWLVGLYRKQIGTPLFVTASSRAFWVERWPSSAGSASLRSRMRGGSRSRPYR